MTDAELLQLWARDRNDAAFAELVRRHQDMVFSACYRKLGNAQSAQDAAQQAFATLAVKAAKVAEHGNIGGWLYKAALLESCSLLKMDTRRDNRHERYRAETSGDPVSAEDNAAELKDLLQHLDNAMLDLRDSDREVLVKRFFQNEPLRTIGAAMGTTEDAARKRVMRAIESLAGIFRRRGVTACSVGMLGAALAQSAHSAPVTLLAVATASAKSGLAAAQSVGAMALLKAKVAVGCTLAAAAVPIGIQWKQNHDLREQNEKLTARLSDTAAAVQRLEKQASIQPVTIPQPLAVTLPSAEGATDGSKRHGPPRDWRREQKKDAQQAARLAMIKSRVGLTPEQERAVAAALQRARDDQKALWESMRSGKKPDFEQMQRTMRAEGGDPDAIRALLSEKQIPEFEKILQQDRLDRSESSANRQMDELQPLLHLNEDQKDAVFQVLAREAYGLDPQVGPPASSFEELRERKMESLTARRDQLAQVLTPEQLALYDAQIDSMDWTQR